MAIGDDATAAGYPLVAQSDLVKQGATEINRSRDFIAQVKGLIKLPWTVAQGGTGANNKASARTNLGVTSGTADPAASSGDNGDIYFKIVG